MIFVHYHKYKDILWSIYKKATMARLIQYLQKQNPNHHRVN